MATDATSDATARTILAVATDLVVTAGLGGFSVDALARRARVSKATIYRRWPSRNDLLFDVCIQLDDTRPAPDTGNLLDDLRIILGELCSLLSSPDRSPVMAAMADGAERDDALEELVATVVSRVRTSLIRALRNAVERGELPATTRPDELADLLVGPLFYRRFFRRAPVDLEQAMQLAHDVLAVRDAG